MNACWIKICVTCDRFGKGRSGALGAELAAAIEAALAARGLETVAALRRVPCLSGCHNPGNIALGGVGNTVRRFHRLGVQDAEAIATLAERYAQSTGDAACWIDLPLELAGRTASLMDFKPVRDKASSHGR